MTRMEFEIRSKSDVYLRHGGKKSRKARIKRLISACEDIETNEKGIKTLGQIGRRHIYQFYARHNDLSKTTLMDYYYAFVYAWQDILKRSSKPPKP